MGTRIDRVNVEELLVHIERRIVEGRKALITYVNVHAMNLAYQTPWFRNFLNSADIVFCDGFGVVLAARLLGHYRLPRLSPPDWISVLCEMCAKRGYSMYFLGGRPGVAERAATRLESVNPGLKIVGTHHGYFNKNHGSDENTKIIENINFHKPSILWLGFGMPLQERWLKENLDTLNVNIAITGGAIFDYISGVTRRGPKWMTEFGFEWLSRLLIEPKRLWRRYLIGNPLFFWRLLMHQLGINKLPE